MRKSELLATPDADVVCIIFPVLLANYDVCARGPGDSDEFVFSVVILLLPLELFVAAKVREAGIGSRLTFDDRTKLATTALECFG